VSVDENEEAGAVPVMVEVSVNSELGEDEVIEVREVCGLMVKGSLEVRVGGGERVENRLTEARGERDKEDEVVKMLLMLTIKTD